MDKGLHIEETAIPILMILVSKFSMENSPGPHVFRFLILPQGGPPWPLEVGKFGKFSVTIMLTQKARDLLNILRTGGHCRILRGIMDFFYYTTIKQTSLDVKKLP